MRKEYETANFYQSVIGLDNGKQLTRTEGTTTQSPGLYFMYGAWAIVGEIKLNKESAQDSALEIRAELIKILRIFTFSL